MRMHMHTLRTCSYICMRFLCMTVRWQTLRTCCRSGTEDLKLLRTYMNYSEASCVQHGFSSRDNGVPILAKPGCLAYLTKPRLTLATSSRVVWCMGVTLLHSTKEGKQRDHWQGLVGAAVSVPSAWGVCSSLCWDRCCL